LDEFPPVWGCTEAAVAKCRVCLRGFKTMGKAFTAHVASCNVKYRDPLPLSQRTLIPFWLRKGTTDENAFVEVFVKGGYERRRAGFRIEDATTWLDLGAHIGTFACLALARGCDVIAFEPHAENADMLEHNARALPAFRGTVTRGNVPALALHRAAVASVAYRTQNAGADGTMELLAHNQDRETYRNTLMRTRDGVNLCSGDLACSKCGVRYRSPKMLEKHEAKCTRAGEFRCTKCDLPFKTAKLLENHTLKCKGPRTFCSDFCPAGRVPVFTLKEVLQAYPQIEGVKIDIEGAEIEMLEEMAPSDWGKVKRLTFEYSNEYDNSAVRFRALLRNLEAHFKGGVHPDKPGTYEVGDEITFPKHLAIVVHASTDPLLPVQSKRPGAITAGLETLTAPTPACKRPKWSSAVLTAEPAAVEA